MPEKKEFIYMLRIIIFIGLSLCSGFCFSQKAEIIKLADLEKLMAQSSGGIHIINFWATWCGPCIEELPYFEKITAEDRPDTEVTLVSMDLELDPDPRKVYRFVSRKGLQSKVVMLNEADPNSWIEKVHPEWSGALPATLIINHKSGERIFIGQRLEEGELEQYLDELQQ